MDERAPAKVLGLLLAVAVVAGLTGYEISQLRKSPAVPTSAATAQSQPPAATSPDASASSKPAEVAAVNPADTAPAAKPGVVPPVAAAPSPEPLPSFDIVRVEPSGEAVVAGQAEPGAKVEVLDGTAPIATAQADESGEWALSLDKPLPPGTHDLAVRMTAKDNATQTLSDQRVTVSVPEKGTKDVLVVMNTPDSASKVLQVPDAAPAAPAAPGNDQASAAAPAAPPASGDQVAAAAPAAQSAPATANAPAEAPAANQQVATAAEPPVTAEPPLTGEAPITAEPQITAEAPIATEPPAKAEPPVATEQQLAKAEPPKPEVAVAAVEADTSGSVYIAGTTKTGETVRVYLDDKPLGEATPSPSGTWLIETKKDLPAGKYTVRADQIDNGGEVIARSEVPFEREVEVAILKPTGQAGGATADASGATLAGTMPEMETVIIKRGDNLWRIARGAWGKGMRWSTIYQANTDQIRNPHWIYPGQVFIMPKGSVTWTD